MCSTPFNGPKPNELAQKAIDRESNEASTGLLLWLNCFTIPLLVGSKIHLRTKDAMNCDRNQKTKRSNVTTMDLCTFHTTAQQRQHCI